MGVPKVQTQTPPKTAQRKRKRVPRALVYEMVRGRPVYYRGYEKVLTGELPPEAVMGSSALQAKIVQVLLLFLHRVLNLKQYEILAHELGFMMASGHWRALDIAVFERQALREEGYPNRYTRTPPLLVIEVDTKADLSRYEGQIEWYIREKVDDLLAAGVQQVLWFTTHDRRVLEARPGQPWTLAPWDRDIPLVVGDVTLNLARLLEEEGIQFVERTKSSDIPKEDHP